jgi:hypothetical protein
MVGSMLSNQLLEAGRQVVGQTAACCGPNPGGPGRLFKKTWMIAFHDLMSYPLLDQFAERRIDLRVCPSVAGIMTDVASETSFFGLAEVANSLSAHSGYGPGEHVGALPARGVGDPNVAPSAAAGARPTRA